MNCSHELDAAQLATHSGPDSEERNLRIHPRPWAAFAFFLTLVGSAGFLVLIPSKRVLKPWATAERGAFLRSSEPWRPALKTNDSQSTKSIRAMVLAQRSTLRTSDSQSTEGIQAMELAAKEGELAAETSAKSTMSFSDTALDLLAVHFLKHSQDMSEHEMTDVRTPGPFCCVSFIELTSEEYETCGLNLR